MCSLKKIICFSFLFFYPLSGNSQLVFCKQLKDSSLKKLELDYINSLKWQLDTIGCIGYREIVIEKLINQKNKLIGLNTKDIIEYFGSPNYFDKSLRSLAYLFKKDIRCDYIEQEESEGSFQTDILHFLYNEKQIIVDVNIESQ